MSLTLTQDDTAPVLTGTVSAVLTGAVVVAHIRRPDKTVLTKAVTVSDALTGAWSVTWVAGDLAQIGTHYLEVQVTFSGGQIQTFAVDTAGQSVRFKARAQIA